MEFPLHTHDHYERLCAAAVSAQITPGEWKELTEHMDTCADCREFVGDVGQVVVPGISEYGEKRGLIEAPAGAGLATIAVLILPVFLRFYKLPLVPASPHVSEQAAMPRNPADVRDDPT